MLEILVLKANGAEFGLPLRDATQVFRVDNLSPVPLTADDIVGLTNVRGTILPLVDLRRKLAGGCARPALGSLAVAIARGEDRYGLVVDEVLTILTIDEGQGLSLPGHARGPEGLACSGYQPCGSALLPMLDAGRLFEPAREVGDGVERSLRHVSASAPKLAPMPR